MNVCGPVPGSALSRHSSPERIGSGKSGAKGRDSPKKSKGCTHRGHTHTEDMHTHNICFTLVQHAVWHTDHCFILSHLYFYDLFVMNMHTLKCGHIPEASTD